jgi:hypothetical protein
MSESKDSNLPSHSDTTFIGGYHGHYTIHFGMNFAHCCVYNTGKVQIPLTGLIPIRSE